MEQAAQRYRVQSAIFFAVLIVIASYRRHWAEVFIVAVLAASLLVDAFVFRLPYRSLSVWTWIAITAALGTLFWFW